MTKQEFMAMSLPYGIYCEIIDFKINYVGNKIEKIVCINQWSKDGRLWSYETTGGAKPSIEGIKPILHPLSDITKEIQHKGEKFVPEENLLDSEMILRNADYRMLRFGDIERLISWHFDIAGLIDKGEAIDVNTLSENPYK